MLTNYLFSIFMTMNNAVLTKVGIRYKGIYLNVSRDDISMDCNITVPVIAFLSKLNENGFTVSEELLRVLSLIPESRLVEISDCINEIMGLDLNWAPLVRGWEVPSGESRIDHVITFIANVLRDEIEIKGTTLPCGHLIPDGTFPLERYNGCPFCGTPFVTADFVYTGQASKLKELRLLTTDDMHDIFVFLLTSATPLEATQADSLENLLSVFSLPTDVKIEIKETVMLVAKSLVDRDRAYEAGRLFKTPTDILRYLWYEKTGFLQILEPKTLIKRARVLYSHVWGPLEQSCEAAEAMKGKLRLKYSRKECLQVARWLNGIEMTARQAAENMNPKRGMWVRMIHALRLGEYSRKPGFRHLASILDVFYNNDYSTWQGKVEAARISSDSGMMLVLLKQRPGLFARCLFSTMLRFGADTVLPEFEKIADALPARLLVSLGNAAESYFDTRLVRVVRTITNVPKVINHNPALAYYSEEEKESMVDAVKLLYQQSISRRFKAMSGKSQSIYIDKLLFDIPISVGDRSATIQDASCALMGTRFQVEGDAIRLFLQWGKGLPAQHLDMDLSCRIALSNNFTEYCYFGNLTCVGAKHSGDIRSIPDKVGTAEYIELNIPELQAAGALYVTFTCNAYSCGALSPNLVVGWMDSANPMTISEETGVAYDPSCVQHAVRISEASLGKGLVFGVLDVQKREIIWLEMPFDSQIIQNANRSAVDALLMRLSKKLTIGQLLEIKAKAQNLQIVDSESEADEVYNYEWVLNPAEVSKLLYL